MSKLTDLWTKIIESWRNLLWTIQRGTDDVFLFLFPPDRTSQVSKYAGVLVEIVPCDISDVARESKHSYRNLGHSTDDPSLLQTGGDSIVDVKILSAGFPVYVPLENKLLIVGKLVKPLPTLYHNTVPSSKSVAPNRP